MSGAALIALPDGTYAIVDACDYTRLNAHRWQRNNGYVTRSTPRAPGKKRGKIQMHREVMGVDCGEGLEPDHINGNRLDNRRANLRAVPHKANIANRALRSDNTTGFKGVSATRGGTFRASIRVHGRTLQLGEFDTAVEAAHAYDEAARAHQGEHACTNFPRAGERPARPGQ